MTGRATPQAKMSPAMTVLPSHPRRILSCPVSGGLVLWLTRENLLSSSLKSHSLLSQLPTC